MLEMVNSIVLKIAVRRLPMQTDPKEEVSVLFRDTQRLFQ